MPRWTLRHRGDVLGLIVETERDMWNVRATFTATGAFDDSVESLFAKKDALATRLEDGDDDALVAEFDVLEEQTSPPDFELVADDGTVQAFSLLCVRASGAGFRLL